MFPKPVVIEGLTVNPLDKAIIYPHWGLEAITNSF